MNKSLDLFSRKFKNILDQYISDMLEFDLDTFEFQVNLFLEYYKNEGVIFDYNKIIVVNDEGDFVNVVVRIKLYQNCDLWSDIEIMIRKPLFD